jgi:hypothetical protein
MKLLTASERPPPPGISPGASAKEGFSMQDHLIRCLLLVRLGQELGTDSEVSRAVFLLVSTLAEICH